MGSGSLGEIIESFNGVTGKETSRLDKGYESGTH